MKCQMIFTGTELILGESLNTNSAYLGQFFSRYGINIDKVVTVGDNRVAILKALQEADGDIIFINGGLGPTEDDLTREALVEYLGLEEVPDEKSMEQIKEYHQSNEIPLLKSSLKVGLVPKGSVVFENKHGSAPGSLVVKDDVSYILTPGPPRELFPMLENMIGPYLQQKFSLDEVIYSSTIKLLGIGESQAEEKIRDLIKGTNPTIAPTVKQDGVHFRITGKGSLGEAETLVENLKKELLKRLGEYVYGENEELLEEKVAELLKKTGHQVATAESCTGGLLASTLTDVPGSSEYFKLGIVTYSNEAKMTELGVSQEILEQHGAVSEETALAMLEGLASKTDASIVISVTGIAGPSGGSREKPVGLVFTGVGYCGKFMVEKNIFKGTRKEIKRMVVQNILFRLLKQIEKEEKCNDVC